MLTRIQVARRIGKSLATVRRLEGQELHPVRDANGVHRFDPDEVERLVIEQHGLREFPLVHSAAPLADSEAERSELWRLEDALRAARARTLDAEVAQQRAERRERRLRAEREDDEKRIAELGAELDAARAANADLRGMLKRVAGLLAESDSDTLQDVGEYLVDVLNGRR